MPTCVYEVSDGTAKMNTDVVEQLWDGYVTMTQPSYPAPTEPGDKIYVLDLPIQDPFPENPPPPPGQIISVFFNGIGISGGAGASTIDLTSPNQVPEETSYQFRFRFRTTPSFPAPVLHAYSKVDVHRVESLFGIFLYTRSPTIEPILDSDNTSWTISIDGRFLRYTLNSDGAVMTAGDQFTEVEYPANFTANTWHILVFDVEGEVTRYKLYPSDSPEPVAWDVQLGTGVNELPSSLRIEWGIGWATAAVQTASFELDYVALQTGGFQSLFDDSITVASGRITEYFEDVAQSFRLTNGYVAGSTEVYVNGTLQRPTIDYTESDSAAGEITLGTIAPGTVTVVYNAIPPSGPPNVGVISPSPSGTVATLSPGDSLQSVINNTDIGTIILTPGNYLPGTIVLPNRTSPLLIQAQNRHTAIIRNGQWLFGGAGSSTPSSNITVDGLSFQGHVVADAGIIIFGYGDCSNISLLNTDFRGNIASVAPQQSHHVYITRGSHTNITFDGYTVVGPGGSMTGFHAFHNEDGPRQFITLRNFDVSGLYAGILIWQTMSNLLIEDGYVRNSSQGVDISSSPTGIIRRVVAINAGSSSIGSGMTQDSNQL